MSKIPAFLRFAPAALFVLFVPTIPVIAAIPEYTIVIKDHRFEPAELKVPAGTKVKLIIRNEDATPEEFESYDFNREKIVSGHSQIKVFVGPLKPGTYKFFGEFNIETAQGRLIVE